MNIWQSCIEAVESLTANKVRTGLTMLGIIIGVAAVIAMLSIGAGAQSAITSQIESFGVNLLYVIPGGEADIPRPMTLQDAAALADPILAPTILRVAPVLMGNFTLSVAGDSTSTNVTAVTADFFKVQTTEVAEGQLFSELQVDNFASVAVIGSETANQLFGRKINVVGENIRIRGQIFKVIGVLKTQGGSNFGNEDNKALVPFTTARLRLMRRTVPDEVDMIYVQATSSDKMSMAEDSIKQILRARHHIVGKDDFDLMSSQNMLDMANQITGTLTIFLGGVAGISLLVGGIGIMNIMLVTVTERTREIGLRKAVGARKRDIRLQFLVESSLLSLGGGILGIILGWSIAMLVGKIATATGSELNPVVKLDSVLLATLFSAGVGLFFGLYPANRAANLVPVEALRSE